MSDCFEMFNASTWRGEITQIKYLFDLFSSFISRDKFIEEFFKEEVDSQNQYDDDDKKWFFRMMDKWYLEYSLDNIQAFFRRQILVLLNTYLELMFSEFVKCFFCQHHNHMYDFLQVEFAVGQVQKGFVSLRKITANKSKRALIDELAADATAKVMSRKFSKQLETIEKLTNSKVPAEIKNGLQDIVEQRNRIVHEYDDSEITAGDIETGIENVIALVEFLTVLAEKNNIELN